MTINERVKELRKELGLTQQQFAKKINIGRANISKIEVGDVSLTDRNIKSICSVFNINEVWLRTGVGDMHETSNLNDKLAFNSGALLGSDDDLKKLFVLGAQELAKNDAVWEVIKPILLEAVSLVQNQDK